MGLLERVSTLIRAKLNDMIRISDRNGSAMPRAPKNHLPEVYSIGRFGLCHSEPISRHESARYNEKGTECRGHDRRGARNREMQRTTGGLNVGLGLWMASALAQSIGIRRRTRFLDRPA